MREGFVDKGAGHTWASAISRLVCPCDRRRPIIAASTAIRESGLTSFTLGVVQPGANTLSNQRPLQLGDRIQYLKYHFPRGRARVHLLAEAHQRDAKRMEGFECT
jgi:hypothetical protein